MDKLTNLISDSPFSQSPVMPEMLEDTAEIQFRCRKGIECWNACCSNIDISLTPVDILRLSRRLGISTTEFIQQYTFPYELEPNGVAGVKFKLKTPAGDKKGAVDGSGVISVGDLKPGKCELELTGLDED